MIRAWWFWVVALVASLVASTSYAQGTAPAREIATFAGGCFWCVESDFDKVPGVLATVSGYMGGKTPKPTYQQVSAGGTGHAEVVQITYDPSKVSFEKLLYVFWRTIDPHDAEGQFCDKGDHYRSEIFYHTPEQKRLAEKSLKELVDSKRLKAPIATKISPASTFTRAEEYHQDFYKKSVVRYTTYRYGCGRNRRVKEVWGAEAGGGTYGK